MRLDTEEERGENSPPDVAHIIEERSSQGKKRDCPSDEEDQRPKKFQKTSREATEKTARENEKTDKNIVISRGTYKRPVDDNSNKTLAIAGCSRDCDAVSNVITSLKNRKKEHTCEEEVCGDGQDEEEDLKAPVELLNLSDDVLLIIMSKLKPTDLMSLSLTCARLSEVTSDWSLWTDVDFRPHSLLEGQLERYLPFFSETTERIATRGFVASKPLPRWRTECLSSGLLSAISHKCPSLRSFTAEEHCIDANKVKISSFPSSVEHLSLKRCEIINHPQDTSYFNSSLWHLTNLKVLELSECKWLPAHSIMAISKLPQLEELYLDGCCLINECIAYSSLAFTLGFPKLKVLDLRRTGVSDSEISCMNRNNRLTHLYLEYPHGYGLSNNGAPEPPCPPGVVSDLGLRSLVVSDKPHVLFNNAEFGINNGEINVSAPVKDKTSLCSLHTLVARNFRNVSDVILGELRFANSLRHLDLSGTGITRFGVELFCAARPEVNFISSFDDNT